MKRAYFAAVVLAAGSTPVGAQDAVRDSIRNVQLENVEVVATRATQKTPVAFTNVGAKQIQSENHGKDIPSLLSTTPSVIVTSDAGTGLGYTGIRVRGTDPTRINITTNGIPMNDAESSTVYWVNTPDIASSLKDIQIQRGVGTSTNGGGAFGASINMQTAHPSFKPMVQFDGSYGSFNTHKETVKASTGLLGNHWAFDVRLSNLGSDGYIDRAWVKLKSYMVQGGYYDENTSLRLIVFGGAERTYHAWYYASKDDMEKYGRTYNPGGYMFKDENGVRKYYDNQIDKYSQTHVQLLFNHAFSKSLSLNTALHYTRGGGYYEEYKRDQTLANYLIASPDTASLIRRKQMSNDFYGGVFALKYNNERWNAVLGGAVNQYKGPHWGNVLSVVEHPDFKGNEYYRTESKKTAGNIYLKATYSFTPAFNLYGDLQYRRILYTIDGLNDSYNQTTGKMNPINVDKTFNFFNPKFGANWDFARNNRIYASFAVAHREPVRDNYTEAKNGANPRPERLFDYELGYQYTNAYMTLGANLYYMDYKDQLIPTGNANEIGEPLSANVPESYRMGVELMANIRPTKWYEWNLNATLSRNRIKNFSSTLYDKWGEGPNAWVVNFGDTPIAYSPDFVMNSVHRFNLGGWNMDILSQYVSKQYMTNTGMEEMTLDSYFTTDVDLSYTFKLKKDRHLKIGATVYNVFNQLYESNGWAGPSWGLDDSGKKVIYPYAAYSAQAGTHFLAYLSVRF